MVSSGGEANTGDEYIDILRSLCVSIVFEKRLDFYGCGGGQ
jgi:hypothetical protein